MDNYLTVKFETAKSIFYTTFAKIKTKLCQDHPLFVTHYQITLMLSFLSFLKMKNQNK